MNSFHVRVGLVGDFVLWIDGAALRCSAVGLGYGVSSLYGCVVMVFLGVRFVVYRLRFLPLRIDININIFISILNIFIRPVLVFLVLLRLPHYILELNTIPQPCISQQHALSPSWVFSPTLPPHQLGHKHPSVLRTPWNIISQQNQLFLLSPPIHHSL